MHLPNWSRAPLVLAVLTLGALACADARADERAEMTVRVANNYPPYIFKDEQGAWAGIEVEMARALVEEAGYKAKFVEIPWNRSIEQLKTGALDIVLTLSKTPERAEFTHFFAPSTFEQMVIVVLEENAHALDAVKTLDDLVAKGRYGINQKVHYTEEFTQRWDADPAFRKRFDPVTNPKLNMKKVKRKRLLGYFRDKLSIEYWIKTSPEYAGLTFIEVPFFPAVPVYFGISKHTDPAKIEALRTAHAALTERAAFQAILDKWTK
jgi:polar amino acid transport system substrate-binding protein